MKCSIGGGFKIGIHEYSKTAIGLMFDKSIIPQLVVLIRSKCQNKANQQSVFCGGEPAKRVVGIRQ